MSQIEDEYKNRFKNRELSNEEFDQDGLWDAITEGLNLDEDQEKNNKRILGFRLLLLIGLVTLVGTYFYIDNNTASDKNDLKNQTVAKQEKVHQNISNQKIEKTTTPVQEIPNKENKIFIQTEKQKITSSKTNLEHLKTTPKSNFTIRNNHQITAQKTVDLSAKNLKKVMPKVQKNRNLKKEFVKDKMIFDLNKNETDKQANSKQVQKSNSINEEENIVTIAKAIGLKLLPTTPLSPIIEKSLLKRIPPYETTIRIKKFAFQLSAFGGFNQTNFKYQSTTNPTLSELKEATEKGIQGFSLGIHSTLIYKQKWLFKTGIEYHQNWSKFEYNQEKVVQIEKENQLLHVWLDGQTGDTLSTQIGTATVEGQETREVVHYNKYQRFSIPIEFGFERNSHGFLMGFTGGALLNFTTNQSGKTLDQEGAIIVFDNDSKAKPYNSFSIGFSVTPFVGYRFRNRWSLKVHPQMTWQSGASLGETDLKTKVRQFNLNLGIGYYFR